MAGGGARRGTLVIHYGTGHRRPAPRPRQPRDEPRSCGSQPAHQSVIDRRLQLPPPAMRDLWTDFLLPTGSETNAHVSPLEKGHESGSLVGRGGKPVAAAFFLTRQ